MSLKKKKPNNRWITGQSRSASNKAIRHLKGIVAGNGRQPSGQAPFTSQQITDLNTAISHLTAGLAMKS